ncbi:site-specific DNA-methyltransferase [Ramlibacter alkalitolerans]|uniref:site-specific DNA-methyltransferase (adenine-specific) n=1 Tax=Ramlibacter alkalitolerans TaxID=2039631 RepID=A0ABS1JTT0_9BURK|nr:site-specific DNA-methyltransferase [Ramlibacter alkalitolerans]MBL0427688.1 site-specific DNA-methyltransferase [Ramlibacter alkalitolerans]
MDYESLSKEELVAILKRRDSMSRYGLRWERERIPPDRHLNRDFVGFELQPQLCVGVAPWDNLLIEGDNYDALRHLATTHSGQFHLVFGDGPYNTGRKDFVYNDSYFDATNRYRHSTWLEFMYQRLVLVRSLLREDGALVMTIDDNELPNLWLLLNQVFGEKCFVANCIWQKRYSRENREAIGDAHEYVLIFSPNPDKFKKRRGKLPLGEKQLKVYRNANNDPRGKWRAVALSAQGYRPNQMYEITSPLTGKVFTPPEGSCWKVIKPRFDELLAQGLIYFGKDGNAMPSRIQYLDDIEGMVPWTWWPHEEVGHTDEARKEIQDIFGSQTAFDTPKPMRLMERIVQICAPEKDALVLDFFAGSGTTGHVVLKMNKEQGTNKRFVLISSREATEDEPQKNLAKDVLAVRIRKAIEGYATGRRGTEIPGLGGNFAYVRAQNVATHRLEEGLTDSMVWTFALQTCSHPLTPVHAGISLSVHRQHLVAYCANTKPATLEQLKGAVSGHHGPAVVLSWAPQAVTEALGDLAERCSFVAVPADLQRAFKQGNAKVADAYELPAIDEPARASEPSALASEPEPENLFDGDEAEQ